MDNLPTIPEGKVNFSIGEVADMLGINASTIRFWEKEFDILVPRKESGRRVYNRSDISIVKKIYKLLYKDNLKIKGAKQVLENGGILPSSEDIPNEPVINDPLPESVKTHPLSESHPPASGNHQNQSAPSAPVLNKPEQIPQASNQQADNNNLINEKPAVLNSTPQNISTQATEKVEQKVKDREIQYIISELKKIQSILQDG
ncbi:MAG: MerR family transcriptional regulator [Spirochaetes bacterium]|nr:MerR family transcriptional regulator [Spirochaetota bacterium]